MTEQEEKIAKLEKEKREIITQLDQEKQNCYALQREFRELKCQNDKFLGIIENLSKVRN